MSFTTRTRAPRVTSARIAIRSALATVACAALTGTLTPAVAAPTNPDDAAIADADRNVDLSTADVATLAGYISSQQEKISSLELKMGGLAEAVNKALVDLHNAQASAEQARQAVNQAKAELSDIQSDIDEAQENLNEISRAQYRRGGSQPLADVSGNSASEDALARQTYLRTQAEKQRAALDELDHARTLQANKESELRAARNLAEQREAEASEAERNARAAIDANAAELEQAGAERQRLRAEQAAAQLRLDEARGTAQGLRDQRQEYQEYQAAEAARKQAEEEARIAAEEARKAAEAKRKAEEAAAAQAAAEAAAREEAQRQAEAAAAAEREAKEQEARRKADAEAAAAAAAAATAALIAASQPEHQSVTSPYPPTEDAAATDIAAISEDSTAATQTESDTDSASSTTTTDSAEDTTADVADDYYVTLPEVETSKSVSDTVSETVSGSRAEKIEMVISRAKSQIGVPYAWGGGNANGPTRGIRDGGVADSYGDYNKVGFDCSGLVLYAFAGVGISLDHYTGYQYNRGTKVNISDIQRGDLLFWGPGGSQHVAIYLGDGTMIEAPQSGSTVKISPVRYSGMSPYAVRLI